MKKIIIGLIIFIVACAAYKFHRQVESPTASDSVVIQAATSCTTTTLADGCACTFNAECDSGNCDADDSFTCQPCVINCSNQLCSNDGQCCASTTNITSSCINAFCSDGVDNCMCNVNSDCETGNCTDGICAAVGYNCAPCTVDSDCSSNYCGVDNLCWIDTCECGDATACNTCPTCTMSGCTGDNANGNGTGCPCNANSNCTTNLCQNYTCACINTTKACTTNTQCCPGNYCANGFCESSSCSSNSDCTTGYYCDTSNGKCKANS